MKGVKKCFGLSLLLFTIFGLSLSVFSDTNALKHDVNYLPISSQSASRGGSAIPIGGSSPGLGIGNPYFNISWSSSDFISGDFKLGQDHYFTSSLFDNRCTFINYSSRYYSLPSISYFGSNGVSFDYGFPSYRFDYSSSYYDHLDVLSCQQSIPFGEIFSSQSNLFSHPDFDNSSLVNIPIADRPPYLSLPPYYYDFDSFYLHDKAIDTNSGITYSSSLKMSDIVGFSPNKFSKLTIPLGMVNKDVVGDITTGRSVELSGVFDFSGEGNYFNWASDLSSNSVFNLSYVGLNSSQSFMGSGYNISGSIPCSTNFRSLDFNNFYQLEFTCEFISPDDIYDGQLWFWLYLDSGDTPSGYLFDTNADWSFASAYFITDHDDTPGGIWGFDPTGNNLNYAPGSASSLLPGDEDFFTSLVNLFGFLFLNPFAPIFQLFSNNETCAQIPTLASLIHSEETQVCPWFDSNVRNILTPVLGLSSMMLIFGFAVRWLGSGSGNMFIDDDVSDTGHSFALRNKFQAMRWRRR